MIQPDFDQGRGEVLLFLNSSNTTYELFSDVMADLSRDFRVIGHNYRSIRTVDCPPFTIEDLAEDTFELMANMGVSQWTVVGSSMGGFVGLKSALLRPEAIERLVLIGTSATRTDEQSALVLEAIDLLAGEDRVPLDWAHWAIRICLSGRFASDNPDIVDAWAERITKMQAANIAEEFRASMGREDLVPHLDRITCPVLVIHGDEDSAFTVAETIAWTDRLPDCECHILEATGHFVSVERPDDCICLIRKFMARF